MRRSYPLLALVLSIPLVFGIGCGSDGSSPTDPGDSSTPNTGIDLSSYRELVEAAAPPAFSSIARGHSDWTSGDHPILGKVFSEHEPMSLYWNIDELDRLIVMIEEALANWEYDAAADTADGEPLEGEEEIVENPEGACYVSECTGPTVIQGFAAGLLGAQVELDYSIEIEIFDQPDQQLQFGFAQSETAETIVAFHAYDYAEFGPSGSRDSFVFYGHRDLVTDEITVRGVFAKVDQSTQEQHQWVYEFRTVGDSEFRYRMAWYAPDPEFVASVIGGGDKDSEFALRYRQMNGPGFDQVDPGDPWGELTQVFGPQFSDGGEFVAAHEELCPADQMFGHADMPGALLTSPFEPYEAR